MNNSRRKEAFNSALLFKKIYLILNLDKTKNILGEV